MIEYGIYDTQSKKLIRKGFSKDQANSFIFVHLSDHKEPWLKIVTRVTGEWE